MKRRKLLDSFAVLAYLNNEKGAQAVLDTLAKAQESGTSVLMNEVNVGEVYYILHRKRGSEKADFFIETVLPSLPIEMVANNLDNVLSAARIKAEYPLSYADCFAAATACKFNAVILTGDPEFKSIEHFVEIEWIPK